MEAKPEYSDERLRLTRWFVFTREETAFFVSITIAQLDLLIQAANFYDMPKLFWYCAQDIARRIRGKDADTVRRMLCKKS